ncbi:MAG TPA: 2-oxoglutarate dehydrogenase, E2 component, dihydrolipoamide succinyltransferase [Gaiellaceae bacterium]|nr:2-oxoglutarate dehydrogenase, E2 component, dihydrolipoamide succinyltransferase [Gaiellaceae bacterium]
MATGTLVDVVMPQMGVSVSEGTITKWAKSEGEPIEADETLLEISTDKVDTEVPSPASGILQQILVQEGETVDVGTKLAVIAPEGSAATPAPAAEERAAEELPEPATQEAAAESAAASGAEGETPTAAEVETPAPPAAPAPAPDGQADGVRFVSPVVARIAAEHGVDVAQVPGTGRGGRVTKKDILGFIESGGAAPPPEAPAPPAEAPTPAEAPAPPTAPAPAAQEGETVEAMSAMRRGIAEHMRRSLDTSAHVTSSIEVDMSKVAAIRQKLKKEYQEAYGVNPTYLAFVARAAVETLKDYPWINGELRGDSIVTRSYVNLGFAVELADGKGLIVPVVKNAETLNLLGTAKAIADIAARAREKKLLPDDVQGGTFTITNPGGYGTFHGTPVISQPQAAILGTYAVVKRPWVVQDEMGEDVIAIRSIMNLTLTYDHRLVDGALAGRFLRDLRERLQTWGESDY